MLVRTRLRVGVHGLARVLAVGGPMVLLAIWSAGGTTAPGGFLAGGLLISLLAGLAAMFWNQLLAPLLRLLRPRDLVRRVEQDGDFYVSLGDLETVRNGIGDLLRKIQVIKSTGNQKAAEALFDKFGTHLDEGWKSNIVERKQKLGAPKIKAFVFPRLEPVYENGEIADVMLFHDEDLTAQQLRFSRLENSTSLDESTP